ncbi:MAG: hypothetical protein JSW64_08700 [Candidatus Zixiibacteriota bacterium]|nr:MAG: hypothetical protein JSW64_08700 [candidate division Zixibacteria bacterium]
MPDQVRHDTSGIVIPAKAGILIIIGAVGVDLRSTRKIAGWGFIPQHKHRHCEESNAVRRRSDLNFMQMIKRFKLDFLALGIILSLLFVVGCPMPRHSLLFKYNGEWRKSLKIEEDSVKMKISGDHIVWDWPDNLDIKIKLEGLDTSKIVFFDTTNFMGQPVNITTYFDDKIIFESEAFPFSFFRVYIEKDRVEIYLDADLNMHETYSHMARDEFMDYLDTFKARIRIEKIFSEPKVMDVKVDKRLLIKKMGKWVPALQENG